MGAEARMASITGASDPRPRSAPFRLAGWRVDPALNRISRERRVRQIEPKVMDVLVRLAAEPGEVVSKQQLLDSSGTATS